MMTTSHQNGPNPNAVSVRASFRSDVVDIDRFPPRPLLLTQHRTDRSEFPSNRRRAHLRGGFRFPHAPRQGDSRRAPRISSGRVFFVSRPELAAASSRAGDRARFFFFFFFFCVADRGSNARRTVSRSFGSRPLRRRPRVHVRPAPARRCWSTPRSPRPSPRRRRATAWFPPRARPQRRPPARRARSRIPRGRRLASLGRLQRRAERLCFRDRAIARFVSLGDASLRFLEHAPHELLVLLHPDTDHATRVAVRGGMRHHRRYRPPARPGVPEAASANRHLPRFRHESLHQFSRETSNDDGSFSTLDLRGAGRDAVPVASRMVQPSAHPGEPDPYLDLSARFTPTMPAVPGSGAHDQWSAFTHERTRDALERMRTTEDARHDALASTCDTRLNAEDEYGDGDQKPILNLLKGRPLRGLWSSSGDLFEKLDGTPCGMSPFCRCFNGDAAAVRRHVDDCRETERSKEDPLSSRQPPSALTRLLEKRESMLRYLLARRGRRRAVPAEPAGGVVRDAAAALVAAGARVDSRDIAGHTALAKCTNGVDTTDACLMIAVDVLGPPARTPTWRTGSGRRPSAPPRRGETSEPVGAARAGRGPRAERRLGVQRAQHVPRPVRLW